MPLGRDVDLGPDDIVLDGDPADPPKGHTPNFHPMSVGQTAGLIQMPTGTKVCLGPGHNLC